MSIFKTLHRSILALFVIVVVAIVTLAHFSVSKIVAEQSRAHQKSISPALSLIVEHLMQPLHIAQTLAKSREINQLMTPAETDREAVRNTLSRLADEFGMLFFIADESSRMQYYSDGSSNTLVEGEVSWYFKFKQHPSDAVADIGKWEDTHFYIDLKMYDDKGEFLGFFGMGKSLESFLRIFSEYKRQHGYDFIFVDENKNIMLSSAPELNARQANFQSLYSLSWYQSLDLTSLPNHSLNNVLIEKDGQDFLIAEVKVAPFDWTLYLLTPMQARQIEISRGFIISVVSLLVVIFALFLLVYHLLYHYRRDTQKSVQRDPLTKLPNRRKIELRFAELQDQKVPVSLLLLDIDHFKTVNETHGHEAGDHILRQVASLLTNEIRAEDAVGRWDGEQFVVLLADTGPHQAYEVAQKLRKRLAEMTASTGSLSLKITVSVGVAFSSAPRSLSELFASADDALYQAKRDGRNLVRVQLFDAA